MYVAFECTIQRMYASRNPDVEYNNKKQSTRMWLSSVLSSVCMRLVTLP